MCYQEDIQKSKGERHKITPYCYPTNLFSCAEYENMLPLLLSLRGDEIFVFAEQTVCGSRLTADASGGTAFLLI